MPAQSSKILLENDQLTSRPLDLQSHQFRVLQLANGMIVTLVCDLDSTESAIVVNVARGSLAENCCGNAHFVEHLLFQGSEKYPEPSEYDEYVAKNGGMTNAMTYDHQTVYFHTIAKNAFDQSVDRIIQNVFKPIFPKKYVSKEIDAVDSEFKMYKSSDSWKIDHASKVLMDPKNKLSRFTVGNLKTLREPFTDEQMVENCKNFHNTNYHPQLMSACLYSSHSLDEMQKMIENYCPFEASAENLPKFSEEITPSKLKRKLDAIYMQPEEDLDTIVFKILYKEDFSGHGKTLEYLLNDKREGTLYSQLKLKGLISSLSVYVYKSTATLNELQITFVLTNEGLKNHLDAIACMRDYFCFLKSADISSYIFDEVILSSKNKFILSNKPDVEQYCMSIAENAYCNPPDQILSRHFLFPEFDQSAEENFLKSLELENFTVFVLSKSLPIESLPLKDDIFEFNYDLRDLKLDDKVNTEIFSFPQPNPYLSPKIATKTPNPDLKLFSSFELTKYATSNGINLTTVSENKFAKDVLKMRIEFNNYSLPDTAENNQMIDVLDLMITNHLESKFCDAKMANINFVVKLRKFGGYAEFEGFVHQLEIFVPNLLKEIFTYSFNKTDLEVFINLYQKNLKSYHGGYPFRAGIKVVRQFFEKNFSYPVNSEYLKLSDNLINLDFGEFFTNLKSNLTIDILAFGTNSAENSKKIVDQVDELAIEAGINTNRRSQPEYSNNQLVNGDGKILVEFESSTDKLNNCVIMVWPLQTGHFSYEASAISKIYTLHMADKFFDDLRTKRQFGYATILRSLIMPEISSVAYIIQSEKSIDEVEFAINEFAQNSIDYLVNVSDKEWNDVLNAEKQLMLSESYSLDKDFEKLLCLWENTKFNITEDNFNWPELCHQALNKLQKDYLVKSLRINMSDESSEKRLLVVHGSKMPK